MPSIQSILQGPCIFTLIAMVLWAWRQELRALLTMSPRDWCVSLVVGLVTWIALGGFN